MTTTISDMIRNAEENCDILIQIEPFLESHARALFNDCLLGALLNYVSPEDFKLAVETASQIAHVPNVRGAAHA